MSYLNNQYLFSTIFKYLIIAAFLRVVNSGLQSPCPNVFEYQYDNTNTLCGFIQVPSPDNYENLIRLDVQLSIGNPVQGFNGNIELASPRSRIVADLLQKRPLQYKLHFPYWIKIPPRVTKIVVNGKQVCSGYPIDKSLVSVLTTINLQHTLTVSIPLSTGSQVNGGSFPDLAFVDDTATPKTTYQYVLVPKPPQSSFNFNPQPPKDPSKIYANNPFLNQNSRFGPTPSTFYQNQRPTDQRGSNFEPHQQNHPFNEASVPAQPHYPVNASPFTPNSPNLPNNPFASIPHQNGGFSSTPNKFEPHNYPQFNHDISSYPKNPSTVKPIINNSQFVPTLSPKESDAEDLPTVESNLVRKPFSNECGISVNSNALLINGNRVAKGVHPWLGALFMQNNEGLKFMCGSTLISQKHVVTAAHCVRNRQRKFRPEELWIVLGRENIQRWSNDGAQIIQAESTYVHSDYQFHTADADIAVIFLSEEAVFSRLIRPACLWTGDKSANLIVEKKGTVVGWGKDESGKVFTPEPRKLTFPVVSEEDCLRSNSGFREITSNRTFCAGYRNNSGPCNGDSGSGFLFQRNGRWTLRGVVSMSLLGDDGNCDLKQYVVFTDVAQYTDWLLSFLS